MSAMVASNRSGGWVEAQSLSRQAFYVACRAESLTSRPLARKILDVPVVLYRASGQAVAFVDRCPHRNVPLSQGCTGADGSITCPYHGWRFGADGHLLSIPGSRAQVERAHQLDALFVREEAGLVWVCPTVGAEPKFLPYLAPHRDDRSYTTVLREVVAPGSLFDVAENALDVPHTAVLHGGLFRKDQERTPIKGYVRRYQYWVETEYVGEQPPRGLVARLLAVGTGDDTARVEHFDRFFLPGVLQVEYRLGKKAHFVITGLLTPEGEASTRLYAVASFRTPLPGRLLALLLEPFARLIFAQDRKMLARQAVSHRTFGGPRYASTELDTMGPQMRRLLRNQARWERGSAGNVEESTKERAAGRAAAQGEVPLALPVVAPAPLRLSAPAAGTLPAEKPTFEKAVDLDA